MSFIPLHAYSGYSLLKSGLKIDKYVETAKKYNYSAVALTDFGNFSGIPSLVHECKDKGIKPIVGEDIFVDNLLTSFFVKNEEGYKNLLAISYENQLGKLNYSFIKAHQKGLIIVLSIQNDALKKSFISSKDDFAKRMAKLSKSFDDFYLGIEITDEINYLDEMRKFAFEHGYKTIAFPFIKYVQKDDAIILEMMKAIETKEVLNYKELSGENYLLDPNEILKLYTDNEVKETENIANKINFEFIAQRGKMISFENDFNLSSDDYLRKLVYEGLEKYGKTSEEYSKRADFELETIKNMGYSDYFLIVNDYVNYARNTNISVGPGRGSASGSLVSYALGITAPDPIENNLLFERFLNPYRQTMPDIDVDFSDIKRDDVVDYISRKYGSDKVARIVALVKLGAKQALNDVGKIFNYSENDIKIFTKLIRDEGEQKSTLREIYKANETFRKLVNDDKYYLQIVTLASKIEGMPRQSSLHAVGIVMNASSLKDVIPLSITPNGELVEQFEKDYIEEQGFLKMDILALTNLTIIENCLTLLKQRGIELDRDSIPYNDPLAIKQIASGKTMGLFQLESRGIRNAIKELKPTCFEDIVALLALYRPGPMDNIPLYAKRKAGLAKITYLSPALKEILSPTYGIIVYQEQIMKIANKMAGFSLAEADTFRRAISKKDSSKLAKLQENFINGSIKQGYNKEEAKKVFDLIYKFADYGFNRSHSMVYAIFSLRMAYLKSHYPDEFFSSILSNSGSDVFNSIIGEMHQAKIGVKCPNINESDYTFKLIGKNILFPLHSVRGISGITATNIICERKNGPFTDFYDFVLRMKKYKFNNSQLMNLIDAGAFDSLEPSRASLRINIPKAINYADMIADTNGQIVIDIGQFTKPFFDRVEDNLNENLTKEFNALGLMISGSPLDGYKDQLAKIKTTTLEDASLHRENIKIPAIIKSVTPKKTKNGKMMAFVTFFDSTSEIELPIFPDTYEKSSAALKQNHCVMISGYYSYRDEKISVTLVEKLEDVLNG